MIILPGSQLMFHNYFIIDSTISKFKFSFSSTKSIAPSLFFSMLLLDIRTCRAILKTQFLYLTSAVIFAESDISSETNDVSVSRRGRIEELKEIRVSKERGDAKGPDEKKERKGASGKVEKDGRRGRPDHSKFPGGNKGPATSWSNYPIHLDWRASGRISARRYQEVHFSAFEHHRSSYEPNLCTFLNYDTTSWTESLVMLG